MELNQEIETEDPAVARVMLALVGRAEKDPEFIIELHDNLRTLLNRTSRPWNKDEEGVWTRKAVVSGRTLATVKNLVDGWYVTGVYLKDTIRIKDASPRGLDKALLQADEHLISQGYNLPDPWEM